MVDDVRLPTASPPTRVSLFITCFNDTMFPQTGRAVVTLLERLGVAVDFPLEQTCCGQMHFNTGYADETIPLVRRFVRAFADSEVVVSPSASCVGMVRDYYPRVAELSGDPALAREVEAITPRVLELTELLVDRLGVEDVGAFFPHRVTYHPTCHSLRMLHVGDRPLRLLRAVRRHRAGRPARGRPSAAASAARSRSRTPTRRSRWSPTRSARSSTPAPRCA